MGWQGVQRWTRLGLASKEFTSGRGGESVYPWRTAKTGGVGHALRSTKCYGIWERVGWFPSSMTQQHKNILDTQSVSVLVHLPLDTISMCSARALGFTCTYPICSVPALHSSESHLLWVLDLFLIPGGVGDPSTCIGSFLMEALQSSAPGAVSPSYGLVCKMPPNILGSFLSWS